MTQQTKERIIMLVFAVLLLIGAYFAAQAPDEAPCHYDPQSNCN